ncbi:MAG TPA: thermonuclease family protein [Steroidobacteraceae bacterium]|nr:thermonuclease family protein [Steroidobacteraceae bacterium]
MGIIRIRGTIDLAQFWPDGQSDADTTKILLSVGNDAFQFAPDGKHFTATHVFNNAVVHGASRKAVINKNKVTIRLQGIDAPELHYRAGPLPRKNSITDAMRKKFNQVNSAERRQHWGETATVALATHLKHVAVNGVVECEAVSKVDQPSDLLDTYGRIVADICIGQQFDHDINEWLATEGWVFPTFYTSMTKEEITTFLDAAKHGKAKDRVWSKLRGDASKFDAALQFRRPGALIDEKKDKGPLIMPKLFRRQVAWQMHRKTGLFKGNLEKFLQANPDECMLLNDFLDNGVHSAKTRYLHEFVDGNRFTKKPHELVFKEKPSTVVDANGKPIEHF